MPWTAADDGQGALMVPFGIAVDGADGVYVADVAVGTVQKYQVALLATSGATPVT